MAAPLKIRASASASTRECSVHGKRQSSKTCLQVPALLCLVFLFCCQFCYHTLFTSEYLFSFLHLSHTLCAVLPLAFGAVSTKIHMAFWYILVHWIWYTQPLASLKHPLAPPTFDMPDTTARLVFHQCLKGPTRVQFRRETSHLGCASCYQRYGRDNNTPCLSTLRGYRCFLYWAHENTGLWW